MELDTTKTKPEVGGSLWAKRKAPALENTRGFRLESPKTVQYKEYDLLRTAVQGQADHVVLLDGDILSAVDLDGGITGTDYRLSKGAFGDLCHFTKVPVSFAKRVARYVDEQMALDMLEGCIRVFFKGADRQLVIDTRHNRVEGIVGTQTYKPVTNLEALEWLMSAKADLEFEGGWLAGPRMRVTACSEKSFDVNAKVGDPVKSGISMLHGIAGDTAGLVQDYTLRLLCTNGMTATDRKHLARVLHRGDVEFNLQKAICASAQRSGFMVDAMKRAAKLFLTEELDEKIESFLRNPQNGGSDKMYTNTIKQASVEAQQEGRDPAEITVWNMVNGVTVQAHQAETIQRRVEIEGLGYLTLMRYGAIEN